MRSTVRGRFWLDTALASLCGFLAVLTLVWRDWIEALTGFDPDHHSGSLEQSIVIALWVVCIAASVLARREWRGPGMPAGSGIR